MVLAHSVSEEEGGKISRKAEKRRDYCVSISVGGARFAATEEEDCPSVRGLFCVCFFALEGEVHVWSRVWDVPVAKTSVLVSRKQECGSLSLTFLFPLPPSFPFFFFFFCLCKRLKRSEGAGQRYVVCAVQCVKEKESCKKCDDICDEIRN